jgi:D-alanyl-D-alanine dipeptidase
LEQGQLNSAQIANRRLLRQVMYKAGFFGIQTEWWHFNASTRAFARENYTLVE